jgi:hypothetical protein
MNYVNYNESPSVKDVVGFELETYDNDGMLKNPHTFEKITIYYIEKNISDDRLIEHKVYNQEIEFQYNKLAATDNPSPEAIKNLKNVLEATSTTHKITYSESKVVMDTITPLWTIDGKKTINNLLKQNGNPIDGKFLFLWKPEGMRAGTYVIRWDWKLDVNRIRSNEKLFYLTADISKLDSIYSRLPPREKYNLLMDKYIPRIYRTQTNTNDLTPQVLVKLNKSVAQGLLEIEDMAVQIGDLLDPTFTHQYFLPLLANFFNLELRSNNVGA